ncbi:DNA cytosine methyltransferase [Klebsiella pneumoniae]|uniref:DNA cytosine methyltransferase n=1 Tax=Klebsiella pneumoniae TaxID=573 RepID=UPI001D0EAADC|nr:DNA cytosine methyltransferase [Klebsiella pneumoniae]
MSWLFSQALAEEYSADTSLAGEQFAQLNVMPTPHKFSRNDKTMEFSSLSRFWSDVCSFDGKPWRGIVDIVSGGFPCQAFSKASRGRITAKSMWPEMRRIVSEVKPGLVFAENVTKDAITIAATDLIAMGYKTRAVQLSAKDMGADHIRERFWLLAYTDHESELLGRVNAEVGISKKFHHSVWDTYSPESILVDGVPFRVDRYRAIGNAQVPIVAATAFCLLANNI